MIYQISLILDISSIFQFPLTYYIKSIEVINIFRWQFLHNTYKKRFCIPLAKSRVYTKSYFFIFENRSIGFKKSKSTKMLLSLLLATLKMNHQKKHCKKFHKGTNSKSADY